MEYLRNRYRRVEWMWIEGGGGRRVYAYALIFALPVATYGASY